MRTILQIRGESPESCAFIQTSTPSREDSRQDPRGPTRLNKKRDKFKGENRSKRRTQERKTLIGRYESGNPAAGMRREQMLGIVHGGRVARSRVNFSHFDGRCRSRLNSIALLANDRIILLDVRQMQAANSFVANISAIRTPRIRKNHS